MSKTILKGEKNQATSANDSIAAPAVPATLTGEHECEAARPENQQPHNTCEEAIRVLAHGKWEAAGYPVGDGFGFWLEAEREVNADRIGSSPAQG